MSIQYDDLDWKEATYGTVMVKFEDLIVYHQQYDNIFAIAKDDGSLGYLEKNISKEEMLSFLDKHEETKKQKDKLMDQLTFELTEETKTYQEKTLYRIRATKDNKHAKKGTLGGWVEGVLIKNTEKKIPALTENAWLGEDAILVNGSRVMENALVAGAATIIDNSVIGKNAKVEGNTWVASSAIFDNAMVKDDASVIGSVIAGNAIIKDSAEINRGSVITGDAVIGENASVSESKINGKVKLSSSCDVPSGCSLTGELEFKNCISSFPGIHLSQEVKIDGEKWAIGVRKDDIEENTKWDYPTQRKNVDSLFFGVKGIDKPAEKTYTDVLEFVQPKKSKAYFLERIVDAPTREIPVNILMDIASREDKYKDALAFYLFMEEYIPLTKKFSPEEAARIIQESTPIVRLEKTDAARSGGIINKECLHDIRESFASQKKMQECAEKHNLPYALLSDLKNDPVFSPEEPIEIAVWPDYTWCYPESIDEYLQNKSDDYMLVSVPFFEEEPSIETLKAIANGEKNYIKSTLEDDMDTPPTHRPLSR